MKAAWEVKELRAVSAINYGYTESASSEPVGPRFLRITDIQDDHVEWGRVPYCKIESADVAKYRLASGDIVFARTGATTGKSFLVNNPPDAVFASYLIRLRLLDKNLVPEFVSLFFQTAGYWKSIREGSAGSAQGGFNATKLGALCIPIPPLTEQQRIVGILDEAFDGIAAAKANAEKNLQNTRALFESYLQAVFTQGGEGWIEKTLGDTCIVERGSSPRPIKNFFTTEPNGVNWIKIGDTVEGEKYIYSTKQKITPQGAKQSRFVKENDFILTNSMSFGRPYIMKTSGYIHDGWFVLRLKDSIDLDYFYYLLASSFVQSQFKSLASGAIVLNISGDLVKQAKLPIAPLIEQQALAQRFRDFSDETQRLESICQQKLAALDELKKSLLHQAFSGELTGQSRRSVVIPFPTRIPNITTTDLHAGILAMAFQLHENEGKLKHFGHVKSEKIAHMVEAYIGIDLGRTPVKDAAGPNDYQHLKRVEHRARMAGFFDFKRVNGGRYHVKKYRHFEGLIERTQEKLGDRRREVDSLLQLMLPMDTQKAEIFCTVYAAWNNLLLDRQQPTDESIVFEARENWHPDKLNIPREQFFTAIDWLRKNGVIPAGKGKKVTAKAHKR
jgi:restriction endonuclease S subunit